MMGARNLTYGWVVTAIGDGRLPHEAPDAQLV